MLWVGLLNSSIWQLCFSQWLIIIFCWLLLDSLFIVCVVFVQCICSVFIWCCVRVFLWCWLIILWCVSVGRLFRVRLVLIDWFSSRFLFLWFLVISVIFWCIELVGECRFRCCGGLLSRICLLLVWLVLQIRCNNLVCLELISLEMLKIFFVCILNDILCILLCWFSCFICSSGVLVCCGFRLKCLFRLWLIIRVISWLVLQCLIGLMQIRWLLCNIVMCCEICVSFFS